MENLREKINAVIKEAPFADEDFRLVRLTSYKQILQSIVEKFKSLKTKQINEWWWNNLLEPTYHFYAKDAFNILPLLVNEKDSVWLDIDDESKKEESYWIYEGKINAVIIVLEELPFCEYYIVSRKLEWILCENHHNLLIGSGEQMVNKMRVISQKHSDKIKL